MNIIFTHRNEELTEAMKLKITEKLNKFEKRIDVSLPVKVVYTSQISNKGKLSDHKLEVMLTSSKKFVKVSREGPEFYALVDEVENVLREELNKTKRK